MSLTVCPAAVVAAPVETVWELLSEPALRDEWWHARTERVVPDGKASAGQVIYLRNPLGRRGMLRVESVNAEKHQIQWVLSGVGVTNTRPPPAQPLTPPPAACNLAETSPSRQVGGLGYSKRLVAG